MMNELKKYFKPELINRIDNIDGRIPKLRFAEFKGKAGR